MRSLPDRIRHTVMFEVIALTMVTFGGSFITGQPIEKIGTLGIMFSALAMVWNFVYNWLFDEWDAKYRNSAPRGVPVRVAHALLFEAFFLVFGVFLVAWWLSMSYLDALLLDVGFSVFFLFYAFGFNWAYDLVFPVPEQSEDELSFDADACPENGTGNT